MGLVIGPSVPGERPPELRISTFCWLHAISLVVERFAASFGALI